MYDFCPLQENIVKILNLFWWFRQYNFKLQLFNQDGSAIPNTMSVGAFSQTSSINYHFFFKYFNLNIGTLFTDTLISG